MIKATIAAGITIQLIHTINATTLKIDKNRAAIKKLSHSIKKYNKLNKPVIIKSKEIYIKINTDTSDLIFLINL